MLHEGESNSGNLKWRPTKMKYCETFLTEAVINLVNVTPCFPCGGGLEYLHHSPASRRKG
jgi:hypothetical protein